MYSRASIEQNVTCPLCRGYLIDTVTLKECTHFFCRRCFLLHLQKKHTCPTCQTQLTELKTAFFRDHTLQNLVYKLTPTTYWKEVQLRADFIEKRVVTTEERRQIADLNLIQFQKHLCEKDEIISLCLAYVSAEKLLGCKMDDEQSPSTSVEQEKREFKRYFRCPAGVQLKDLKTIMSAKFDFPENIVLAFVQESSKEILEDKYTLQDIVYLFGWEREAPLHISFTAMEKSPEIVEEEEPPVLEMEVCINQFDASMNSPTLVEEPEEPKTLIPALTINLSTAQCIPDTLNGGVATRYPIITEAIPPAPKRRRRNGPKKEKSTKGLPAIAPNTSSMLTTGSKIQLPNGQEWIVGSPMTFASAFNTSMALYGPQLGKSNVERKIETTPIVIPPNASIVPRPPSVNQAPTRSPTPPPPQLELAHVIVPSNNKVTARSSKESSPSKSQTKSAPRPFIMPRSVSPVGHASALLSNDEQIIEKPKSPTLMAKVGDLPCSSSLPTTTNTIQNLAILNSLFPKTDPIMFQTSIESVVANIARVKALHHVKNTSASTISTPKTPEKNVTLKPIDSPKPETCKNTNTIFKALKNPRPNNTKPSSAPNKHCGLSAVPRPNSKPVGSSIIPIMTDRQPMLTVSKAGRSP